MAVICPPENCVGPHLSLQLPGNQRADCGHIPLECQKYPINFTNWCYMNTSFSRILKELLKVLPYHSNNNNNKNIKIFILYSALSSNAVLLY